MAEPSLLSPHSFPDLRRATWLAAIFSGDLAAACDEVLGVFAERVVPTSVEGLDLDALTLPITIPVDEHGVVVLSTGHVDAPRHPAALTVARPRARPRRGGWLAAYALGRTEGEALVLPGLYDAGAARRDDRLAELRTLSVGVSAKGLAVTGTRRDRTAAPLRLDETTARLLATALLITVGVKLRKAERGIR